MSKKICRLCLAYPSVCFSLLETDIANMLEALTTIKVQPNDVISTISCTKCMLNVKLAFSIQQNILRADERLRSDDFLIRADIKQEVPDIIIEESTNEIVLLKTEDLDANCDVSLDPVKLCDSKCVVCGTKVDENSLVKHVQDHFSTKQSCDCCSKIFENIDEYRKHSNHTQSEQSCKKCGVKFRYKSLYNVHMKMAHSKKLASEETVKKFLQPKLKELAQSSFSCEICLKQFKFKKQLDAHSHEKKKCPICEAQITKSNIKKHIMNHSSGPQICELCGATLRSLESLRGHLAHTHSSVQYDCEECGKVFRKRYPYLLHKKKHSGEKSHVCETCGKSFLTFFYLNKHIKTAHLKLRPYVCEYCKKAFSSKFALRTHVRQHTNETPYKCEICGDGFRQNVSLRAHRKSKHNIVEPKTCACKVCGKEFSSEQAIISHMRLH